MLETPQTVGFKCRVILIWFTLCCHFFTPRENRKQSEEQLITRINQSTPSDRSKMIHHTRHEDCLGKQSNVDRWRATHKDADDITAITAIVESADKDSQQPPKPLSLSPPPPLQRRPWPETNAGWDQYSNSNDSAQLHEMEEEMYDFKRSVWAPTTARSLPMTYETGRHLRRPRKYNSRPSGLNKTNSWTY